MLRRALAFHLLLLLAAPVAEAVTAPQTVAIKLVSRGKRTFRIHGLLSLQRKLVLRLVQAGYAVVGPQKPHLIRLTIAARGRRLTLTAEAKGKQRRRSLRRGRARESSYHLEVVHKAVLLVRRLVSELPPAPQAVEPTPTSPPTSSAPPPPRAEPSDDPLAGTVPVIDQPLPEDRLPETPSAQPTAPAKPPAATKHRQPATAPRAAITQHAPARAEPEPEPEPEPRQPTIRLPLWTRTRAFSLAAGVETLYRLHGVDPQFALTARYGTINSGFALRAAVDLVPSITATLMVFEWTAGLGISWRLQLNEALHLEIAAVAGFLHHYYTLDAIPDRGSRFGFAGSLPLELAYRFNQRLALQLRLTLGLSDKSRVHWLDNNLIWQRSWAKLAGGLHLIVRL
ncbi:MAG: hypothetical protein H6707_06940 [Deltaproteobacteria bacterium]|nr:hypothetical protein [Deltaproteobacteria bacterium]